MSKFVLKIEPEWTQHLEGQIFKGVGVLSMDAKFLTARPMSDNKPALFFLEGGRYEAQYERKFYITATGWELPSHLWLIYLTSIFYTDYYDAPEEWHIFEERGAGQ